MKRLLPALVALFGISTLIFADDEVTVRSREKPIIGVVKNESPKGITVEKGKLKETFGADEIVDIYYDTANLDAKDGPYSGARKEERDSLDPAKIEKRKGHLQLAIKKYDEVHGKIKEIQTRRHLKYKVAILQARLASEEGEPAATAIKALVDFKTTYPAAWQIVPVMQTLAQMYVDQGQLPEAMAVYEELAGMELSEDAQLDAQLRVASLMIRNKKPVEAQKKLVGLLSKLPKGSRHAQRAQVAIGECLAAQDKADEAIAMLRGIIKDTTDKGVKAAAYNTVGESLFKKELYKEARWEFLWVDVVYNQDRFEHARALYNLARTFDAMGEADRGLECREMLATDRQFAGLELQRAAQKELGGDKKGKSK